MISARLQLALEKLTSSDWERFERLSSRFLVSEFDDLRTVASPSGDEGRDAELFAENEVSSIVMQYSVAKDWRAKINATVSRLKKTLPHVTMLIYMSNQIIGADADDLKKKLRVKSGLALDVRDRNWFLERVNKSRTTESAAEDLSAVIVDPLLAKSGVGPYVQAELSNDESIAAVTFLGLKWEDDTRDKGLTKLAFESLVLSALEATSSENRMPRQKILDAVLALLPQHDVADVSSLVTSALHRLAKKKIKYWPGVDEFCLSHEEVLHYQEFKVKKALAEQNTLTALAEISEKIFTLNKVPAEFIEKFEKCLRKSVDAILFERSQTFAMAVHDGQVATFADGDFSTTLISLMARSGLPKIPKIDWVALTRAAVSEVLTSSHSAIHTYLRSLSDSYTLLAFLKLTPDVQSAVEKMFSHGKLWLDASIILPLIAETLEADDAESGRFTRMIRAAREANVGLFVTSGIVEEVERHMNRSLVCSRILFQTWEGAVPFLLNKFVGKGRSIASFARWLDNFRGDVRPLDDISTYLQEEFGISTCSLEEESKKVSSELRHALQILWHERFERRKEVYGVPLEPLAIDRLVQHDVECYCGVINLRLREQASSFGYSAWWLTVDRQTFDLNARLRPLMKDAPPNSPVMSADFLVNYLAFGPNRKRINKTTEAELPLLMMMSNATPVNAELIKEAENLRERMKDSPERVIRRNVRDHLDRARGHIGPIALQGLDEIDEAIDNFPLPLPHQDDGS